MGNDELAVLAAALSAIAAVAAAIAAFRAPLSAARLAAALQTAAAERQRKSDLLRRVVGLRSAPPTAEWTAALNEVAVTFNGSAAVMDALKAFEARIRTAGGHTNEDLVVLLDAMLADLGLNREGLDNEFLLRPFRPAQL
jgi:hypothetical protein